MIVLLILLFTAFAHGQEPASSQPPAEAVAPTAYLIGAQDVLSVTVYGEADLTKGSITVDSDGTFDFPLIGRVQAGGRTVRQIEADIKARLGASYLRDPSVTVEVVKFRSQTVYVTGQVRNPGKFTLSGDASIMTVLAEAGSVTAEAGSYVVITHAHGTSPVATDAADPAGGEIRVSRRDLETGRAQNVRLHDGDTIFVPRAETFFVTGFVRQPGSFVLDGDVTVLQAISLAGGPTERAAMNRVKIRRIVNGETQDVKVKLTDLVQPNDTIIVPQRIL
jgi:polysaccharide export outer membrane protein